MSIRRALSLRGGLEGGRQITYQKSIVFKAFSHIPAKPDSVASFPRLCMILSASSTPKNAEDLKVFGLPRESGEVIILRDRLKVRILVFLGLVF